ncbi:hypothetical protein KEM48_012768 [Puccinia striiformis f. sp. tritici PST-130]|nr:hypothetical protein KEM48_012768 [Puccinia striiformis f. sp. tritici PST-130]
MPTSNKYLPTGAKCHLYVQPEDQPTTYKAFSESVVYECKDQVKYTGTIKDDDTTVHNEVSFARGITALAKSNVTKTTLNLSMINPNKVAKKLHQAQVLAKELLHKKVAQDKAEAKEARTAKRKAANCGTNDDDDDDDDQEDDEDVVDDVKFHMREINKFNLANVLYDHDLQVCISPADKTKYATLTHVICQTWAQAISQGKDGVHSKNPPKGLRFKT